MKGKSCMHCTRRASVEKLVSAHYEYFTLNPLGGRVPFHRMPSSTYKATVYLCEECAKAEIRSLEAKVKEAS